MIFVSHLLYILLFSHRFERKYSLSGRVDACNESTEHTDKNNERHCKRMVRRKTGNDSEMAAERTLRNRSFIKSR